MSKFPDFPKDLSLEERTGRGERLAREERELQDERPQLVAQPFHHVEERVALGVGGVGFEDVLSVGLRGLARVHDAARELGGDPEVRRRLGGPAVDRAGFGNGIVGRIHLDDVELREHDVERGVEDPARSVLLEPGPPGGGIVRAVTGVIDRSGVADEIGRIALPTLIIVGDQDVATPLARAERIRERIPGSRLVVIPGAGHSSAIEEPEAVNQVLVEFLGEVRTSPRSPS